MRYLINLLQRKYSMNFSKLSILASAILLCNAAISAELDTKQEDDLLNATPVEMIRVTRDDVAPAYFDAGQNQAVNQPEQKRLVSQGSVNLRLSDDGKIINWTYVTGWVPDVFGINSLQCDNPNNYGLGQFIPTANVSMFLDDVRIGYSFVPTTQMARNDAGVCYLNGYTTYTSSPFEIFPPGNYRIEANLNKGGVIASTSNSFAEKACTGRYKPYLVAWSRNDEITDNFYTTSEADNMGAVKLYGYISRGVPFYLPPRFNPLGGTPEIQNEFRRFYKGPPQTEHAYSTNPGETPIFVSAGYVNEKVEGYVYRTNKPGTTPLYRYRQTLLNGDDQYYYSIQPNDPYAIGYLNEGSMGYVCANGG
jgi:hypothetical protein